MKKKNIVILCICIIVSFIIGYFVGDTTAINRVNSSISKSVANTTVSNSTNATATKTSSVTKQDKTYKVGEEGKSGAWSIKVLNSNETNTIQSGDGTSNNTTQQKFIVIGLQMTDISTTPQQYSTNDFILGNMKNSKQYNADSDAMETANNKETIFNENSSFFGVYTDINPSTPKQTYIIFEVPKDFNISDGVLMHGTSGSDATGYYIK